MNREEIKYVIANLIRDHVTPVDRTPGIWCEQVTEKILEYLESIGVVIKVSSNIRPTVYHVVNPSASWNLPK